MVCWMISRINKNELILGSLQFKNEFIQSKTTDIFYLTGIIYLTAYKSINKYM